MDIVLDFDGTVVMHDFPIYGKSKVNYKELLQGIVSMLNSPVGVSVKPPFQSGDFKIKLTENTRECSVTLDLGYVILKQRKYQHDLIDDYMYEQLYVAFIKTVFQDHIWKQQYQSYIKD